MAHCIMPYRPLKNTRKNVLLCVKNELDQVQPNVSTRHATRAQVLPTDLCHAARVYNALNMTRPITPEVACWSCMSLCPSDGDFFLVFEQHWKLDQPLVTKLVCKNCWRRFPSIQFWRLVLEFNADIATLRMKGLPGCYISAYEKATGNYFHEQRAILEWMLDVFTRYSAELLRYGIVWPEEDFDPLWIQFKEKRIAEMDSKLN